MREKTKAEKSHGRLVGVLHFVAACAWLALAALIFEAPVREHLAPPEVALELPSISESGFMVEVTSVPSGTLSVEGVERGATPVWASVNCSDGEQVAFEITREGYATWRRLVVCKEGERQKLTAQLRR